MGRSWTHELVEFPRCGSFAFSVDLHLHLLCALPQSLLLFPRGLLLSFRLFFQNTVLVFIFNGGLFMPPKQSISKHAQGKGRGEKKRRTCRLACSCSFCRRIAANLADISSSVKRSYVTTPSEHALTRFGKLDGARTLACGVSGT